MIKRGMLMHLTPIGSKSTSIAKILNLGWNLVSCCAKFYVLTGALKEPEEDDETMKMKREDY